MANENVVRINDNTMMIDYGLLDIKRVGAVYLVKAGQTCLIDSGTPEGAVNIVQALDSIDAFPPDMLILTHSHWDHSQGTPILCKEAEKRGKKLRVLASENAIPNLQDQSWNRVFDEKHKYENILEVESLKDGQVLDLDGLELEIMDFAGHCADDIALYDKKNRTIFIGDSIGYKIENILTFPPFMPPFWDKDGFYAAVEKLKQTDYEKLCMAHFGCLQGEEAEKYPEEAVMTYETWWNVFVDAESQERLNDIAYVKESLLKELDITTLPDLEIKKASMRILLSTINFFRKAIGKKPIRVAEVQMEAIIGWLIKGYQGSLT